MTRRLLAVCAAVGVAHLCGCAAQYSFGIRKYFPTEKRPRYGVYVGISPKEWPGVGKERTATFGIALNDFSRKRGDVRYAREILVSNLDYKIDLKDESLDVLAWDQAEPKRRWLVRFKRNPEGRFALVSESGRFEN